jgi:protein-S-isoprenylcysteine O-methyltransferase Ste14
MLHLRIPPPVVALLSAGAMWAIATNTWRADVPFSIRLAAGLFIMVCGETLGIAGILQFRRHRTTINPFAPHRTSALVTQGVYRVSRNPMYTGLMISLMGWGVFLASPLAFFVLPFTVWYLTSFQITPEEHVLQNQFGNEFARYCDATPRWVTIFSGNKKDA